VRVLLIDDDDAVRETLREFLARGGHEVVEARDGAEALAELARARPDAILCDRMMRVMSGYELLEVVRRDWPTLDSVPFFFLTGLADERDVAAVEHLRPAGYLRKPIRQAELLAALDAAVPPAAAKPRDD
jgi:two-component system alkaline phosphatase synthesis response regulator PhoP